MAIRVHIASDDDQAAAAVTRFLDNHPDFRTNSVLDADGRPSQRRDEPGPAVLLLVGLPRAFLLRNVSEFCRARPRMAVVGLYDCERDRHVFREAGLRDTLRLTDDFEGLVDALATAASVDPSKSASLFAAAAQ